jgi:galactose oxidase
VFWDRRDAYVIYPPPPPETRPANEVGHWDMAPYTSGVVGVHAALLHTNQVLFWSFRPPDDPNADPVPAQYAVSTVLDLSTGSLLHPSYEGPLPDLDNIFCGGHAFLPDGRLLVRAMLETCG